MMVGNVGAPVRFGQAGGGHPRFSTGRPNGGRVRPTRYAAAIRVSHIVPSPYEQGVGMNQEHP